MRYIESFKFKQIKQYQQQLRSHLAKGEEEFKNILKSVGAKYKYQAVFADKNLPFIFDFLVRRPYRIIFEIDGKDHLFKCDKDLNRTIRVYDNKSNYEIIRFEANEVLKNPQKVKIQVMDVLNSILAKKKIMNINIKVKGMNYAN